MGRSAEDEGCRKEQDEWSREELSDQPIKIDTVGHRRSGRAGQRR